MIQTAPKKYVVQPGFSFRLHDGSVAGEGDVIELADEVIKANPGCVQAHVEEETKTEAEPQVLQAPAPTVEPGAAA